MPHGLLVIGTRAFVRRVLADTPQACLDFAFVGEREACEAWAEDHDLIVVADDRTVTIAQGEPLCVGD